MSNYSRIYRFFAFVIIFSVPSFSNDLMFKSRTDYMLDRKLTSINANDFDLDGKIDLVFLMRGDYGSSGDDTLLYLRNLGGGAFSSPAAFVVGDYPRTVISIDINNDIFPDLITSNYNSGTISLLYNNGSSGFDNAINYYAGLNPINAQAADFNNDSLVDLISLDHWHKFAIMMNRDSGLFDSAVFFKAGRDPFGLTLGDFNNDGFIDVVTSNAGSNVAYKYLNNGNSAFTDTLRIFTGSMPYVAVSGDFNDDQNIDLAVSSGQHIFILQNDGTATFEQIDMIVVGPHVQTIFLFDVDNDGDIDILTEYSIEYILVLLINDGSGHFNTRVIFDVNSPANGVSASDLDNNGYDEIISANDTGFSVFWRSESGDIIESQSLNLEYRPLNGTYGDYDRDDDLDILLTYKDLDSITIFRNNGYGTFDRFNSFKIDSLAHKIQSCDLDNDGYLDFGTVDYYANVLCLYENNGGLSFSKKCSIGPVQLLSDFALANVVGDGLADILLKTPHNIFIYENMGGWNFTLRSTLSPDKNFVTLISCDVNNDGMPDIVAGDANKISIFVNQGNYNFINTDLITVGYYPTSLYCSDINNDDFIDIVTTIQFNNEIVILYNNGDGSFDLDNTYKVGNWPNAVLVDDLDNDCDLDILTKNLASGNVSVLLNDGDGDFKINYHYGTHGNPLAMFYDDFNNDGVIDIITINEFKNSISILAGLDLVPNDVIDEGPFIGTPRSYLLSQNYPNPFNLTTRIEYDVFCKSHIEISIYNILGEKIRVLVDKELPAGNYSINWDGKNSSGYYVSSGIYLYQLKVNDYSETKKMILIK